LYRIKFIVTFLDLRFQSAAIGALQVGSVNANDNDNGRCWLKSEIVKIVKAQPQASPIFF
jgi:hypothetical protein